MLARGVAAACVAAILCLPALAQYSAESHLGPGDLLVASEKLGDPNFAESVILVLRHDEDEGTLGVIINRRSEIPLSKVFPDIKGANPDPVFLGGPVSLDAVQALVRLGKESDGVKHVAGDVYVTGSKDVIESSVRSHETPAKFRLYAGYAGWAAGQLDIELRVGAWRIMSDRSKAVFDDDPDSLWARLTRESHMQVAEGFLNERGTGRLSFDQSRIYAGSEVYPRFPLRLFLEEKVTRR